MEEYTSPVYKVRPVPVEKVMANSYNPNVVAPPEMHYWKSPSGKMASPHLAYAITYRRKICMNWLTVITVIWS